jgi:adenylate cyclase
LQPGGSCSTRTGDEGYARKRWGRETDKALQHLHGADVDVTEAPELPPIDTYWREYLEQGEAYVRFGRRVFSALPRDPRCRICAAPFAGLGAPIMRAIGRRPSDGNPNVCTACQNELIKHHGGAEVSGTMLFADIRGSTSLAERISAAEFKDILERFYRVASRAVIEHDGAIDKFVGDELVAMFYPALAGERHAAAAVEAARAILRGTGHGSAKGPWVPVGAGVHTGRVWFGAVGEPPHVELTALGDPVNTAARLAAAAGAGEIVVSAETAAMANLEDGLERRSLLVKGKQKAINVVILGPEATGR